jgi:hypothetical protein
VLGLEPVQRRELDRAVKLLSGVFGEACSASPYLLPRRLSSAVDPSTSLKSIVIVPEGSPPWIRLSGHNGCR